jgi:Flp pilus assembly CpaF family ATPase
MFDYDLVARARSALVDAMGGEDRRRRAEGLPTLTGDEERAWAASFVAEVVADENRSRLRAGVARLSAGEERDVLDGVDALVFGMGRFQRFVVDPDIDNVIVHGGESVVIEWCDGRVTEEASPWADDADLEADLRGLASRRGRSERRFDTSHPWLDQRLPDGSRLSAVCAVAHRTTAVLRRHRYFDVDLATLVTIGTIDDRLAHFLEAAMAARLNILVAGETNVGKTTLLRALLACCDPLEHLVTVETSLELGLQNLRHRHRHVTAMEAREDNAEGEGAITVADLVRRALRLNPDRTVVGEVLGDEVLPMLNAMGNGANGLTTLHARSSGAVCRRLASYAAQAPRSLAPERIAPLAQDAIDLIVFLAKVPDGEGRRRRVVASVREVHDSAAGDLQAPELFTPGAGGRGVPAGLVSRHLFELEAVGFDRGCLEPAGAGR